MDIVNEMLRKRFGICYMMPYQELVIRRILEDSRRKEKSGSITIFPTGGGKSLCFMLPSLLMFPRYSVIIYPLLSLMNDQKRRFDEMDVQAVLIRGGLERTERAKRIRELKERKANILITNVESLYLMFLRDELNFLKGETELFVLDEAHTVISWGESFRSSYRNLGAIIAEISPHQILSFSATIDRKIEINSYMIFAPVFFASIGINASFSGFNVNMVWFSLCFVLVAIAAKMLGCFGMAKLLRYDWKDSLVIGVGMIARGEVCLIVLQKGISAGLASPDYLAMGVLLVIVSSFLAPVLLKLIYRKSDPLPPLSADVLPVSVEVSEKTQDIVQ